MPPANTGYQPRNTPAERRAFFEQDRRLREINESLADYATQTYVDEALVDFVTDAELVTALTPYATKTYVDARTPRIVIGSSAQTTSAGGLVTVPHTLGVAPTVVLVSTNTGTLWVLTPHTYTSTNFGVTVRNGADGLPVASAAITVKWMAAV